jgi:hypothetical protein
MLLMAYAMQFLLEERELKYLSFEKSKINFASGLRVWKVSIVSMHQETQYKYNLTNFIAILHDFFYSSTDWM